VGAGVGTPASKVGDRLGEGVGCPAAMVGESVGTEITIGKVGASEGLIVGGRSRIRR
jgi:hypothetical protein